MVDSHHSANATVSEKLEHLHDVNEHLHDNEHLHYINEHLHDNSSSAGTVLPIVWQNKNAKYMSMSEYQILSIYQGDAFCHVHRITPLINLLQTKFDLKINTTGPVFEIPSLYYLHKRLVYVLKIP